MITKKEIKKLVERKNKKMSQESYVKLNKIIFLKIKEYLENAIVNSDLEGRKIIKAKDIED